MPSKRLSMALRYYRRLRMQPVSKTFATVSDMRKLRTHVRALATGTLSAHSNPYPPSFSRAAEVEFCASLTGLASGHIEEAFAEIENDRQFVDQLRNRYARLRPEWPDGLHLGRFKVWYALCRLCQPMVVLETGVHDGLSSAVIIRGLARNGRGILVSIDLPSSDLPISCDGPGWLVPQEARERWRLHLGDARVLLPDLAKKFAPIDLFIHDSDHRPPHRQFEYRTVRPWLAEGGLLLTDADIDDMLAELAIEWSAKHAKTQSVGPPYNAFLGGLRFGEQLPAVRDTPAASSRSVPEEGR